MQEKQNPNVNPGINFQSMFCNGCGGVLDENHSEQCTYTKGTFCSQCGQKKHDFVCYPDPRRLEQFGLKTAIVAPTPKKLPKPLFS